MIDSLAIPTYPKKGVGSSEWSLVEGQQRVQVTKRLTRPRLHRRRALDRGCGALVADLYKQT